MIIILLVSRRISKIIYLDENTEKYKTWAVTIEEEVTRIIKNEEDITKNISSVLWLLLSNLPYNLCEGLHTIKCKLGHDDNKCEICRIKYKYCNCFLEYTNFKDDIME